MKTKSPTIASLDFDYVNSDIEKNFPIEAPRNTDFKVFHFDKYVTSEEAIKRIEAEGYLPATLGELLSFAKDGWDNKQTVTALGSVAKVNGNRRVPALWKFGSERVLDLDWFGGGWRERCRFLAVRNTKTLETKNSALGTSDTLTLDRAIEIVKEAGYQIAKIV